ncbi:MAG TPA: dihydrodipicolinate synthase family protein [Puia sp.]|nr:dihydrodipicolinate synthase family protein [Puia sp.]
MSSSIEKIEGLITAVFTPYAENGDIRLDTIPEYARRMKEMGLAGVFVNGSTGEGMLLSVEERKAVAEAWTVFSEKDFKVIVHVGSTSVRISADLAAHAQRCGAYAVACMAPSFFAPSDVDIIVDYCRQVAAAAPALPFYYYHLPYVTGVHIKVHQFLKKGMELIPNLAGVKYTHSDFMDMHQCLVLGDGRFDILHGPDEMLLNGLVLSIKGAIGTTYNFIPGVYQRIIAAYRDNDMALARSYQLKANSVVEVMLRYVNAIVGGKAIMKVSGIDCGPCRTPLRNLTAAEYRQLEKDLQAIGFHQLLAENRLVHV